MTELGKLSGKAYTRQDFEPRQHDTYNVHPNVKMRKLNEAFT